MGRKLAQLQATDPANWKGKTTDDVKAAFTEAGFTPYDHFVAFGNAENLSPNSQFDMQYYLASKAVDLNSVAYQGKQDWTGEKVYQAIQDSGLSVWDHYQQYGAVEGIAPNANFDSDKYYLAKVAQLNSTAHEGRTDWTVDEVKQAFQDAGLSPLAHYAEYGSSEKMDNYATGNANFAVVDNDADVQQMITDNPFDPTTGNKDYTLADAMAASEDGTLSEVYTLTDLNAGDVTVAEYGAIKGLVDGAFNSADLDPAAAVYTLNDTLANLQDAPASAIKGSVIESVPANVILTDIMTTNGLLASGKIDDANIKSGLGATAIEYHITGTEEGEVVSAVALGNDGAIKLTMLAGGDGADFVQGADNATGAAGPYREVLFAGNMTEKVGDVYAESQQSAIASGTAAPQGFLDAFVGPVGTPWVDSKVVGKYFTGHNILDGREGANDLVASNQADTFLIQLGGFSSSGAVDSETPGENTIHQFKVGQDYLFVMDQGDRDNGGVTGNPLMTFSGGWTLGAVNNSSNIQLIWEGDKLTVTIKESFLDLQHDSGGVAAGKDLIITLLGVQNGSTATTAADLFGITE